jgi:hypothetical protein
MAERTQIAVCLCMLGMALAAPSFAAEPEVHPDSAGWGDLFAKDISNAVAPERVWVWLGETLTAAKDECIWTEKEYDDFILDLEFKTAEGTNSGVIVYCTDVKSWIPNSVEIQIADDFSPKWSKAPKTWQCAAVFGHKPASERRVKKPGEWNRMTVTCRGPNITVALNGAVVNQMDMTRWTSAKTNPDGSDIPPWLSKPKAELPTRGRIGLQGKHAGAPIFFRNVKIKPLE